MRKQVQSTLPIFLCLILLTSLISSSNAQFVSMPPPTPHFILTEPLMNKISYVIYVVNQGTRNSEGVTLDFAMPRTYAPDSYIEMKDVAIISNGITSHEHYVDRENTRLRIFAPNIRPNEHLTVNITFFSLKYKVEFARPLLSGAGYPVEYLVYTQPEKYIESSDPLIVSKAQALMGARVDTFRIAQRMYDFVISYLSYAKQSETRGALWALQNGKGDCTEFGMLFVALLRAVGIPSRTVSGFVSRGFSMPPPPPLGAMTSTAHLWTEFYVDGIGWLPVDPTFGRSTPADHFAILWSRYLPFLKGPSMKSPEHSLISLQYTGSVLNYTSQLFVTPLEFPSFTDHTIINLFQADNLTDTMRQVADRAYNYGFNITDSYPTMEKAYKSLFDATNAINMGELTTANLYLTSTNQDAQKAIDSIVGIVESVARAAVNKAWFDAKFLGAIGGENYLQKSVSASSKSDYANLVRFAHYAKEAADRAPSIIYFLGPLVLCLFTVWYIRKNRGKTNPQLKRVET